MYLKKKICTLFVQGLNEINPKAAELEESNALALAIVSPGMLHGFWYLSEIFLVYVSLVECHDRFVNALIVSLGPHLVFQKDTRPCFDWK